jgi:hypothetical protein
MSTIGRSTRRSWGMFTLSVAAKLNAVHSPNCLAQRSFAPSRRPQDHRLSVDRHRGLGTGNLECLRFLRSSRPDNHGRTQSFADARQASRFAYIEWLHTRFRRIFRLGRLVPQARFINTLPWPILFRLRQIVVLVPTAMPGSRIHLTA